RIVDRIERAEHNLGVVLLQHLRDRRRQRRLAVVNVTNRAYVAVRLITLKFFLRHFPQPLALFCFVIVVARAPSPACLSNTEKSCGTCAATALPLARASTS